MGVTNSNKQLSTDKIDCSGTLKVTLAFSASPNISENPTDIVLVLDRSGSMTGTPLVNMKKGADKFIDIIDASTDGSQDGIIGGGSKIGIVSFSDTAAQNAPLITSVSTLKAAVASLTAGGLTNHADAFSKAMTLFSASSTNQKVIVMFTDGKTTTGLPPAPVAAAARASGIIIYCIGLVGADGLDTSALNDWATDPDASHVAITPDDGDLEDLFADLAANISKPGATNIVIDEEITPDFAIQSILPPSKGTVSMISATQLQWKVDKLGVTANEGATLEFIIKHVAATSGTKAVNAQITYHDTESNSVTFPSPTVNVDCSVVVYPEDCPVPVPVTIGGCQDSVVFDMGNTMMESLGRLLHVNINLKNICPKRRVALAVILTEVDAHGDEHPRGMKFITVPAHSAVSCRDVLVKCIKFVLPEDLDVSGGCPYSICNPRHFKLRTIAHYIDNGYTCCNDD